MPAERVSMRRIREILRGKYEDGATERAIARTIGVARSTVALTLERVTAVQLGWPLPAGLSDAVLEAMLYAGAGRPQGSRGKAEPDWTHVPPRCNMRPGLIHRPGDRYGRGATLITSQIPVNRWHDLIGEPTLADAILDRIIHNAHRLQLRGDSLRPCVACSSFTHAATSNGRMVVSESPRVSHQAKNRLQARA